MNLPNKLTILRILMIPVIVALYLLPFQEWNVLFPIYLIGGVRLSLLNIIVLVIYVLAAITDTIDGHIARSRNLITTFGKFADPIADKLLTTTMFLLFVFQGIIPVLPVILMISRDTIVDGCRMVASANGKVVAAGVLGKAKTVLQMVTVALILLNNLPFALLHIPFSDIMLWTSAFVSVVSGVQYLYQMKDDILESK